MDKNPLKWPIYCISGIAATIILFVSIFISYLHYPIPFSIFTNYVSHLGNIFRNPSGASYFNIGLIITGITLFPFFIGFYLFYTETTWRNVLIIGSQIMGFSASVSLVFVGIFPEHKLSEHLFWSYLFFILILIFVVLSAIALFKHENYINELSYLGIGITVIYVIFFYWVVNNIYSGLNYLVEWLMFFSTFVYIGMIIFNMLRIKDR